jgi:type I restriction enzyme S subunit
MGQAPSGDHYNTDGQGWPLISGAGDFGNGLPRAKKYTTVKTRLSQTDDLILGVRATIGEMVRADGIYCLGRGVAGLRPKDGLDLRYLWHWMTSAKVELASKGRGATFKQVNRADIAGMSIPLPLLDEQRRIAAILDKADELRAKRRAAVEKLNTLAEAVFVKKFGEPLAPSAETPMTTLGNAVKFHGGGTPSRAVPEYFDGNICWATSKDMKHKFLDDTQEHITPEAIERSATKLVPPGTILVVVKSKVLAHSLPVALSRVPTCFGQDLKGLQPLVGWDPTYVATSLRLASRWLLERARGVNTEGLTLEHLKAVPLIDAPKADQDHFAETMSRVEHLRSMQESQSREESDLIASLQQRAFRGEL